MKNINKDNFNSFADMLEVFPTEGKYREYLEEIIWKGKPVCPHCGVKNKEHYKLKVKGEFKGQYKCKDCRERFTIRKGTVLESSPIPIRKWFIAMYIFTSHKKGLSSTQLAKDLGLTQKSAWFMLHRIRSIFSTNQTEKFTGIIQSDESFIGGKNKNRHADKKVKDSQGRSTKDKTPVFGLLNQQEGIVNINVVSDTKAKTLKPIIEQMVEKGAIVVTDEWGAYKGLSDNFQHEVVKHNEGQYMNNGFHTNSIEGFWSLFKRGIYGIYHFTSKKHLSRYTDEFSYRYNTRQLLDKDRFILSLNKIDGRLTYQQLIAE